MADATRRLLVDHAAGLVPEQDMMRRVHQVVAHGIRRPGTAAGHRVAGWVADQLRAHRVKDVRCEPFPVRTWSPGAPERSRLLPTDGGILHLHGVPVVDFLSAPVYLFDSADTPAMVHAPSLEPISRAVVRIIGSLMGRSAADVRT